MNGSTLVFKNFAGISAVNFINTSANFSYRDEVLYTNRGNGGTGTATAVFGTQVVNINVG
jgi:hypothetical protein